MSQSDPLAALMMTPCLGTVLRRASRAVTRVYDAELRETGLRITQYSLLSLLNRAGELRQGDLGTLASLEETSLTRALRVMHENGWVSLRQGEDRREKLVALTDAGREVLENARPAWRRAQERLQEAMTGEVWSQLLDDLPRATAAVADL